MTMPRQHSAEFLRLQKTRLLRAREEVATTLSGITQDTAVVEKLDGKDLGDHGRAATEADFNLSLSEKSHNTLRDIDDALHRIEKGTYGKCELTGELIPTARLVALPFARCTVQAQRDLERHSHKVRQFGIEFDDTVVGEEDSS
jgi:RNA polymerase-binding transcription factor DksA